MGSTPWPQPKYYCFCFQVKKDAESSETEKYAKIFIDIFAMVSVKNLDIFLDIFIRYWKFSFRTKVFFFIKNIRFRPFCIFWYEYWKIIIKIPIFFQKSAKKRFFPYKLFFLRLPLVRRGILQFHCWAKIKKLQGSS